MLLFSIPVLYVVRELTEKTVSLETIFFIVFCLGLGISSGFLPACWGSVEALSLFLLWPFIFQSLIAIARNTR